MYYPSGGRRLNAKIQAPLLLAEIRALRRSSVERSPVVHQALAIADQVEQRYDLSRADLFVPAFETFCAILEPLEQAPVAGVLRRVGHEIFRQYVAILGIPAANANTALQLRDGADLVRRICAVYAERVVGPESGALTADAVGGQLAVTDTSFMPCPLQIGMFLGAGKLTGLLCETALVEIRCRSRGDSVCRYELAV